MLNFIILDDDPTHNINTNKRLQSIFKEHDIEAQVVLQTTKPEIVVEYVSSSNGGCNVYLLDVDVQSNMNGIELASIIRNRDVRAYIVFISAHPEYVMHSLKTKIFDYLIKPVSIDTLAECTNSINKDFIKSNSPEVQSISIKSGFNIYTLDFNEITLFEKYGHRLVVHMISGKIESSETLDSIESRVDKSIFYRCHKSYVVNVSHVLRIDSLDNTLYLKNGETCVVSKRCKKELKTLCALL